VGKLYGLLQRYLSIFIHQWSSVTHAQGLTSQRDTLYNWKLGTIDREINQMAIYPNPAQKHNSLTSCCYKWRPNSL
jgi:hypothetical protein